MCGITTGISIMNLTTGGSGFVNVPTQKALNIHLISSGIIFIHLATLLKYTPNVLNGTRISDAASCGSVSHRVFLVDVFQGG